MKNKYRNKQKKNEGGVMKLIYITRYTYHKKKEKKSQITQNKEKEREN